jgi:hypothetical protein
MWLTDKLFGGKKGPTPLLLRAYGKLPFYQDFLGIRADEGTVSRRFRDWMDSGFAGTYEMGGRAAGPMVSAPRSVLFRSDGGQTAVAAVVYESHDRNALREFPIAYFVELSAAELEADGLGPAVLLEHLWSELAVVHEEAAGCASAGDFYERLTPVVLTRRSDLDGTREHLAAEWNKAALAEWFDSLAPAGDRREGMAIVHAAMHLMRNDPGVPVRLPLSPLLGPAAQADLWLKLGERAGGSMWLPLEQSAGGTLCLSPREPRPWDARLFRELPAAGLAEGGWTDLCAAPVEPASGFDRFAAVMEAELAAGDRRVGDLPVLAAL